MLPNGQTCGGFVLNKEPKKLKNIPVIYADKPGRNRNIYSKKTLKEAVEYYKKLVQLDPTYKYVLIKHPKDESEEWAGLIAGVIDDLHFNDQKNRLEMDVTLLPTIWGDFVHWLVKHDYVIGTSIRGQATPEPGVYNLNGKQISVVYRTDLKLEGVDFVIYPSFITTHASRENLLEKTFNGSLPITEDPVNFERVLESYSKDLAQELDVPIDDIKEMIKNSKQESIEEEVAMNKFNQDLDQTQIELLKVQAEKLQLEIETKQQQKEIVEAELNKLTSELEKVQESVKLKADVVKELSSFEKEYNEKKAEYERLLQELEHAKEELAKVEEARKRAHKSAALHCCGKFFDEKNPPKVRVVPVDEKVSDTGWGEVDKDALRKIVWLTQDKELANKVFGLVEDDKGWMSFKYPVYQPMKSEEDGYDVDLVLNRYGLAKALGYMQSRGFAVLKPEQKKQLVKFLYDKYAELQKAGLAEIPASLEKLAKNMKVMEKVIFPQDELASMVLESALANGIIEIEGIEQLTDEDKIDLSDIDITRVINAFLMKQDENVSEAIDKSKLPTGDNAILVMIKKDDQPTDFADQYDLTSPDDFKSALGDMVDDEDADFLKFLQQAIYAYLDAVLEEPDDAKAVLQPVFDVINDVIQNAGGEGEEGGQQAQGEGGNEEGNNQQGEGMQGQEGQEQTNEQTQVSEQTSNEDCDDIEDEEARRKCKKKKMSKEDRAVFEQLKAYLENQFENVKIESEEDIMEAVKKLVSDYTEVYAELQKVQTEMIKEQKIKELKDLGVSEDVIDEELADIQDPEELETVVEKLKNIFNKVKESTKKDGVDPLQLRKGVSQTEQDSAKNDTMFDKLMRNI